MKKIIVTMITIIVMMVGLVVPVSATSSDETCDGKVTISDAVRLAKVDTYETFGTDCIAILSIEGIDIWMHNGKIVETHPYSSGWGWIDNDPDYIREFVKMKYEDNHYGGPVLGL